MIKADDSDLVKIVNLFRRGIVLGGHFIRGENFSPGRVKEEENFDLFISHDDNFPSARLMSVKIFHGRMKYYLPWVELHLIEHEIRFNDNSTFYYFGSKEEREILLVFARCSALNRLFVDYMNDIETRSALLRGIPPPLTRLGYLLLTVGFTWFKDWYYPEGFREGGVKLQAEKALSENQRKRHLISLKKEIESFRSNEAVLNGGDDLVQKALKRAQLLIKMIDDGYNIGR